MVSEQKDIYVVRKTDGKEYTVRNDRRRYFFPDEWLAFMKHITNKHHRFFFITALHTGGRAMEILNLKHGDIDVERGTVEFRVVKHRAARTKPHSQGKTRRFFVASEFIREYKSFIRGTKPDPDSYLFLNNNELPEDYDKKNNRYRKRYFGKKLTAYAQILKRKLKEAGIEDWYNFSLHNLRKTYGMWMRTFNVEMMELCYRMGHDMDTFMEHYGSALIFDQRERMKIARIMGEVK